MNFLFTGQQDINRTVDNGLPVHWPTGYKSCTEDNGLSVHWPTGNGGGGQLAVGGWGAGSADPN